MHHCTAGSIVTVTTEWALQSYLRGSLRLHARHLHWLIGTPDRHSSTHLWNTQEHHVHAAQASSRAKCPAGLDMSVHILTSGYWPTYPVLEAKLPVELTQYQTVFKDFYLSKHSGRRLVWHNSLGTCTVRAHFSKGVKELSVSLFQVLLADVQP